MIALALLLAATPPARAAQYKLLPGAEGQLCLECHKEFQQKLKKPYVHAPVKGQDCTGCHNPHASQHGKLLDADAGKVCASCHKDVAPAQARSVHKPVADGACTGCHDAHASDNKFELVKPGAQACVSCHEAITDAARQAKFKHVAGGQVSCATCHEPHASAGAEHLLKGEDPALCLGCHKADKGFTRLHMNYPVQKARCTTCHDPHGSSKPAMLYDTVHKPMANRQCTECHVAPASAKPFETKAAGVALCKSCHASQVSQMLDQPFVHRAVADPVACLNCHNPHASRQRGLVKGSMLKVCGTCHADTVARQEKSPTKHKPVNGGDCSACHSPHSSENAGLMKKAETIQLCGTCHDWQKHSTHPIGAKLKDPRNKNLTMDCLSCHRAHGTEYKHMNPYPTTTELCTKCHTEFKR